MITAFGGQGLSLLCFLIAPERQERRVVLVDNEEAVTFRGSLMGEGHAVGYTRSLGILTADYTLRRGMEAKYVRQYELKPAIDRKSTLMMRSMASRLGPKGTGSRNGNID